ncbi:MAG TPA: NAD(+) synthase [Candidatus Hydrogenedentes bacterium]|nr:NAD(+) synthase [Candidatus Hydrogenedentota bacterium]
MRLVKIGVASVSVKVGDFTGNAARLREVIQAARAQRVHLLVTPELALSGYSLEDRVFWPDIARRSWQTLEDLAADAKGIAFFAGLPVCMGAMMYNGAALVHDGAVRGVILKKYLPTYSIFYEGRNWTAWRQGVTEIHGVPAGDLVFKLPFGCVSAEICEDLWSSNQPAGERVRAGAEIICNGSASPFTPLKNEQRKRLVLGAAGSLACVYAYANLLGCDSSRLVFDGGGLVATPDGLVAEGPVLSKDYWTLAAGVVNLDDVGRVRAENSTWRHNAEESQHSCGPLFVDISQGAYTQADVREYAAQLPGNLFLASGSEMSVGADAFLDQLFDALVLGLRDYFEKVGAFDTFLVALSGGRDSALCLLLAVNAAKALRAGGAAGEYARRVRAAYLPNKEFSSDATQSAARALAEELGVPFTVSDISDEARIAFKKAVELAGGADKVTPLARQNLQARIRGSMMLNWANNERGLLLVTSNLSEAAVGYTTTGGDNQGGYSPIANVPKTIVSALLERIAARDKIAALGQVLAIPPSAELAPDQTDEDDLMPYVVLDDLLFLFARRRMSLPDCWRILVSRHQDHDAEQLRTWTARFGKLFVQSQWKREQLPVTLKVLDLDLDPKTGFRFPVTQSIEAELEELAAARL